MYNVDWGESRKVEVLLSSDDAADDIEGTSKLTLDVTCTSASHFGVSSRFARSGPSGRSYHYRMRLHRRVPLQRAHLSKVFFAGDSGYRSVRDGHTRCTIALGRRLAVRCWADSNWVSAHSEGSSESCMLFFGVWSYVKCRRHQRCSAFL